MGRYPESGRDSLDIWESLGLGARWQPTFPTVAWSTIPRGFVQQPPWIGAVAARAGWLLLPGECSSGGSPGPTASDCGHRLGSPRDARPATARSRRARTDRGRPLLLGPLSPETGDADHPAG